MKRRLLRSSFWMVVVLLCGMKLVMSSSTHTIGATPALEITKVALEEKVLGGPKIHPIIWIIVIVVIAATINGILKGGAREKAGEVKGWVAKLFKPAEGEKIWPTIAKYSGLAMMVGAIIYGLTLIPIEKRGLLVTPIAILAYLIILAIVFLATREKGFSEFLNSLVTLALVTALGFLTYSWWPSPTGSGAGTSGEWELCWEKHASNPGYNPSVRKLCSPVTHMNMVSNSLLIETQDEKGEAGAVLVWDQTHQREGTWYTTSARTEVGGTWGLGRISDTLWSGFCKDQGSGGANFTMILRQK